MSENIGPYPHNEFIQMWLDKWKSTVAPGHDLISLQIREIQWLTAIRDDLAKAITEIQTIKPDSDYANAVQKLVSFWGDRLQQRRKDIMTMVSAYREMRSTVLSMLKAAEYDTAELELLEDQIDAVIETEQ